MILMIYGDPKYPMTQSLIQKTSSHDKMIAIFGAHQRKNQDDSLEDGELA